MAPRGPADVAAASSRRFTLTPRAHHATVTVPEGGVTSGFTTSACARGDLFTVKPEVCPTPYRARATGYITMKALSTFKAVVDVILAWLPLRWS